MGGKTLGDFGTDFAAVHMDGEVAITTEADRSLRVLVRQPAQPRAARMVAFGDATSMPSRSAKKPWQAFQIASKVRSGAKSPA